MPNPENRTEVVLANQPRLLREMLHLVLDKTPGLHVVAESGNLQSLGMLLHHKRVKWLVVSLDRDGEMPLEAGALIQEQRVQAILGITHDGSALRVVSRRPASGQYRTMFYNVSLDQLLALLLSRDSTQRSD